MIHRINKKNRRVRQKAKREQRRKAAAQSNEIASLLSSSHVRRDARRCAELYSLGVCTEEESKQMFRKLHEFGMDAKKIRGLTSVITAKSRIIKAEQEERKIKIVELRDCIPVAPTAPVPKDEPEIVDDEPLPLAFLDDSATEEELAETLKVLIDSGVAERMINQIVTE